jgi:hypothetical protein
MGRSFSSNIGEGRSQQEVNVFCAAAKELNHDHIQTVEEILAEFSFLHGAEDQRWWLR